MKSTVLSIDGKEKRFDKSGQVYYRVYVTLADQTDGYYWMDDKTPPISVGDKVICFVDDRYSVIKVILAK